MPFITRRSIPAATLLITLTSAQCYYPNGNPASNDVPCQSRGGASSCCSSDSFCLSDGLCYQGGLVMRGSCTDKSWKSAACASVCKDVETNTEVALTPCSSGGSTNTFVCGVNNTDCQSDSNTFSLSSDTSIVFRPSQIETLVKGALSSTTATTSAQCSSTAVPAGYYSGGALAGLALGLAIPLLIALAVMYSLLRKEKRRFAKPKLMYKLPDDVNKDDFTFKPPPAPVAFPTFGSDRESTRTTVVSRRGSMHTLGTMASTTITLGKPSSFMERYEQMKKAAMKSSAAELESPLQEMPRYELSDTRMSKN